MGNSAKAVILAEDLCSQNLAYGWLKQCGLEPREIHVVPVLARGSGEQWVRESFADQLAALRQRRNRMSCWLYVLTDADSMTVEERLRTLPSAANDPVTLLVPRRHVETWVVTLTTSARVDEVTNYKERHPNPANGTAAGKRLALAREPEEAWPPSLKRGHEQLRRSLRDSGLF